MEIQLSKPNDERASAWAAATSCVQITSDRVHGLLEHRDAFALSTTAPIFAGLHDLDVAEPDDSDILCATNTLLQRLVANEVRVS